MSRTTRLLDLVQTLRRHRAPVSAQVLAKELDVSVRSVYRDIETLRGHGAAIEGEAGMGYVLKPGFLLQLADALRAPLVATVPVARRPSK
jgi:predicted DNA-binding transcriptional regulator YafY